MSSLWRVGQRASQARTFSQADFDRFAVLSGDDNPIHTDPTFSAQSKFGRTVAHGMFLYSVVCGVLGAKLPGPGTVQLSQELMFPSATFAGAEAAIEIEITEMLEGQRAHLSTTVTKRDGTFGLQGASLVHLPGARLVFPDRTGGAESGPREVATLRDMELGQRAETRRTFTSDDLAEYADLTGDTNPVFTDTAHARRRGLDGPLIPGGLLGGLFSCLLGTRLPGKGANYLKQRLEFVAPAHPGQELVAAVEIVRIRPDKQLVNLSTICTSPGGVICRGEALVLVSDVGLCG